MVTRITDDDDDEEEEEEDKCRTKESSMPIEFMLQIAVTGLSLSAWCQMSLLLSFQLVVDQIYTKSPKLLIGRWQQHWWMCLSRNSGSRKRVFSKALPQN